MEKNWILKSQGDEEVVRQLAADLQIEQALANLLIQRNVSTFDEAKAFFNESSCSIRAVTTPAAIKVWNKAPGKKSLCSM